MRNLLVGGLIMLASVGAQAQYLAGDYGSWVSGSWATPGTWRVYDGTSWASSPAAGSAPSANARVFIRTGTTVVATYGGSYYCQDLFVETGGKLYNNDGGPTNLSYIYVYGTQIICDGQIGNGSTLDGISFGIEGANVSLSGTGTFDAARLVKRTVAHPLTFAPMTTTNFTISMDVNLRFSTGSNTMMFNYCTSASNFHVTIGAGATVTLIGAGGSGNLSMDGLTGNDTGALGGSYTVDGTLIVPGTIYMTTNNTAAAYTCRFTINNGGYVRAGQLSCGTLAAGAAKHTLAVNNGGTLEITGSPVAWVSYFTGANNQYQFQPASQTIYSGNGGQDIRGVGGGYGNLRITGTGVKSLAGTTLVKGALVIDNVAGTPSLDVSISNFQLSVQGNWNSYSPNAFVERNGLVLFNGTAASQVISTSGGEQFFNWTIAKTNVNPLVTLSSSVTVGNTLRLGNSGAGTDAAIIDLNGNELSLLNASGGATGAIVTNSSFGVSRHIRSERTDNLSRVRWDIGTTTGTHLVPFGTTAAYTPFTFDLLSGDAGSVTMSTYGTPPDNLPWPTTPTAVTSLNSYMNLLSPDNRDATVDRFWQIDPTGTPTAALTFGYADFELPISPYDDPLTLRAQRWSASGQLWEDQIEGSGMAYSATADVVTAFGPFTITNVLSPLPVEWLRFTARAEAGKVLLDWTTASERDNALFTVLRSKDAVTYEEIAQVPGSGTIGLPVDYRAVDDRPWMGTSYYKLRQTDSNGAWSETDAVPVRFGMEAPLPGLFPNPVRDVAYLLNLPQGTADILVSDATGRLMMSLRKDDDADRFEFDARQLPAGAYFVTVRSGQAQSTLRLIRD
ncbi:MAG: T9SS type A sorting domain-containing protein [Flavobacteriales bacterium]|nr:T9SS type A sorting domain-containing protein [Flavobacteriales bacterium]